MTRADSARPAVATAVPAVAAPRVARALAWLALAGVLMVTAGVRWRLLDVPLERDEGEYAYAAQLLLRGVAPYDQLYSMKPPGTYVAYAGLLAVFGDSPSTARSVHLGLLWVNAATIVFVFLLAGHMLGRVASVAAAAAFAALSTGAAVQGMFANTEHFVVLPMVAGCWVLARGAPARAAAFWAGVLFGIAVVMKQHGAVFSIAGAVALALSTRSAGRVAERLSLFGVGVVLPYALVAAWLWLAGVFDTFWLWTVQYALAYTGQIPLSELPLRLASRSLRVMGPAWILWCMAGVGLAALFRAGLTRQRAPLLVLAAASLLAILPGLYLRPHYFVLMLPAAALLFAVCVRELAGLAPRGWVRATAVATLVAVPVAHTAWAQRLVLFALPPEQVVRAVYPRNPFAEAPVVAQYIAGQTAPEDRIAVVGSEPQIYYYAGRPGATGFIYTYPLGEAHPFAEAMQDRMIAEIEANDPAFVVWVRASASWGPRHADAATRLLGWLPGYLDGYELAMTVDLAPGGARYLEGPAVAKRGERARDSLEIYRRRGHGR